MDNRYLIMQQSAEALRADILALFATEKDPVRGLVLWQLIADARDIESGIGRLVEAVKSQEDE